MQDICGTDVVLFIQDSKSGAGLDIRILAPEEVAS